MGGVFASDLTHRSIGSHLPRHLLGDVYAISQAVHMLPVVTRRVRG